MRVSSNLLVGKLLPMGFWENANEYGLEFFQASPPRVTEGRIVVIELAHPDPVVAVILGIHSQTASGILGDTSDRVLNRNQRDRKLYERNTASILITRLMLVVRTKSGLDDIVPTKEGAPIFVRNSVFSSKSNMLFGEP